MEKSQKITLISCIIAIGFTMAVFYHYMQSAYLHLGIPFNTFIWWPNLAFSDFLDVSAAAKNFAPFQKPIWYINYFPLAYIFLFPFTLIKHKIFGYLIFLSIFLSFWIPFNIKTFKCKDLNFVQNLQNLFFLTYVSYPFIMLVDRGNFDMMLFIMLAGFLSFYKKEKYLLSAVILAVFNAIKPFMAIFLVLLLFKKKFKEVFFSIILSLLLVVGGFMILKGDFWDQILVFIMNITACKYIYLLDSSFSNGNGLYANSSLFMPLKLLIFSLNLQNIINNVILVKIYSVISSVITLTTIFFVWKEKVFWKQVSLLTLCALVTPYIMIDYKLLFLFIPMGLFVNAKEKTKFDLIYTILFALLLIPKNITILSQLAWGSMFSLSVVVNPLIMLLFMGLIIFEQFYNKKESKIGD